MRTRFSLFLIIWFVMAWTLPVFAASPFSGNVNVAVQWLASHQNVDGSWCDGDIKYSCTSEAVQALQAVNQHNSAYYWGIAWLENNSPQNTDHAARRVLTLAPHSDNVSNELAFLQSAQTVVAAGNNGWGVNSSYQGSPLDSALVLLAYAQKNIITNVPAALTYLKTAQLAAANDKGWPVAQESTSDPATTSLVLLALAANSADSTLAEPISHGIAALSSKVSSTSPQYIRALAALAYLKTGYTAQGYTLLNSLAAAQASDGSWTQDAYATAIAVRAMAAAMGSDLSTLAATVSIADPNLRAAINAALGRNAMDAINKGDMAGLTTLNANGRGITNLSGIENAINLTSIDLRGNNIASLAPLSALTNVLVQIESPQTITFSPPGSIIYGDVITLIGTGGASGNPVTFVVTSGSGTISGNTLTATGVGPIVITASQAGNANYFAAPDVQRTITVTKANQSITFNPPATKHGDDLPFNLIATGGASGNPVTFTVTSGPGTLNGATLTITGTGNIVITANQAGNSLYNPAANIQRTISVIYTSIIISPPHLSNGVTCNVYSQNLLASGGLLPYKWSLTSGSSLPAGLTLNTTTGAISGTPTVIGSYSFNYAVSDSIGASASSTATIIINNGTYHWNNLSQGTSYITMNLSGNFNILGRSATVCDEIAAYDSIGTLVGVFHVQNQGLYGDMKIYGDDAATTIVDEGANNGEKLTIRVWDGISGHEYAMPQVLQLTHQQYMPGYVNYQGPLTFTANSYKWMDIAVETGVSINLKAGVNMVGWTTKQGYYEGTTVPLATDFISGGIMTSLTSRKISEIFTAMGFVTGEYFSAVGPNGEVYVPGSPVNTLKKLLPGKGYDIKVNADKIITIPGSSLGFADQLSLNTGWVLAAYWGSDGVSPGDGFHCINGYYDVIADDESGNTYQPGSATNTLAVVRSKKSYWIHVTSPTILKYQCQ